jgi:hypothetical protein
VIDEEMPDHENSFLLVRETHELLGILGPDRERFFHEDVLAGAKGRGGESEVGLGRGSDEQRVDGAVGDELGEVGDPSSRRREVVESRERPSVAIAYSGEDGASQFYEAPCDVTTPAPGSRQGQPLKLGHREAGYRLRTAEQNGILSRPRIWPFEMSSRLTFHRISLHVV